jgi:hypothetical protein
MLEGTNGKGRRDSKSSCDSLSRKVPGLTPLSGAMCFNGCGHGVNGLEDTLGDFGIGDFETVVFVEADNKLQGVNRVETQAIRPEQDLVVANFIGANLKHQVVDHHSFDLRFQFLSHTRRVALK